MGLQAEYVRRGEDTSPTPFNITAQDGYNHINVDLAEIEGGTFWPTSGNDAVVFVEAEFLAVSTSGDNTGAGALIRRATYFIDATGPNLHVARQEHDRIRGGSTTDMTTGDSGKPDYTTKPYDKTAQTATGASFPEQISVRDAADTGSQLVARNSMSGTVPDIAWPMRTCEFSSSGGPNGLSVIRAEWSIFEKSANTYSVSWQIKIKIYRP